MSKPGSWGSSATLPEYDDPDEAFHLVPPLLDNYFGRKIARFLGTARRNIDRSQPGTQLPDVLPSPRGQDRRS